MEIMQFQAEPKASLKARFNEALTPEYDLERCLTGKQAMPGTLRKHVFDFEFGVRMIVSTDFDKMGRAVHFSFGIPPESLFDPRSLPVIAKGIIAEFWHEPVVLDTEFTNRAYHVFCKPD